jgi:hypothetical protein
MPGQGSPEVSAASIARALRLPVFATATTLLAVAAHVAGGGSRPGPGLVLLLSCLVALAFSRFAQHERSYPRLLTAVGAVQVGMHLALLDPQDAAHAGHHTGSPLDLLVAHGVAVLVVAWWLRQGEAATWRALRRVFPSRCRSGPAEVVLPVRGLALLPAPAAFPASALVPGLPGRRGPPQG